MMKSIMRITMRRIKSQCPVPGTRGKIKEIEVEIGRTCMGNGIGVLDFLAL